MEEDDVSTCTRKDNERIFTCEVCGKNRSKYTCPKCEVKTCCLECVKIHKKELDCDGLRDRVKFKRLKDFDNIDLLNDYRLLEETDRVVNKSVKLPPVSCFNITNGLLPGELYRLRAAALRRGVHLYYLPPSFTRHKTNTSYLDHEMQDLFWKIDWVFPQAENILFTDERVLDSTVLSACVHKYIKPDELDYPRLSFYQSAGHSAIKLLLKAERTAPNRFFLLDPSSTLRDNLSGKSVIEYPVIYVVLNHHLDSFNIFTEDEEQNLYKRLRRRHYLNKNKPSFNNNFLFSRNNEKEDGESNVQQVSNSESFPVVEENSDFSSMSSQHRYNPYHSRGRGQHYYRNRRNFRRGRGRYGRFSHRNRRDSINGGLSKNLSSIHI